ncbi:MAG TPA: NAD(P)-binding domain-containing protein [Jatrophihabitans sp.]|jgi:putative flavoprotein involved in K+ transport|nr:NAD(P)-binding domain-containing protein [Jatrophihabitans sp.]
MSTVVIGAGQAGLAVSRQLSELGVEHVVLERARVAQTWRDRWDAFTLVTPNWTMDLPGNPYTGDDPEGHVPRDDIVAYLESYAAGAPIREGVRVDALRAGAAGGFRSCTSQGELDASSVVVCTGAYQRPFRPAAAAGFPPGVLVMDANDYRSPDGLPDGQVLVIGSGQTGCQLAEELHLAGRDVFLACGRAPWAPRRLDGLDIVTWLARTSFFDQRLAELPSPAARLTANVQATGAGGGHDLHYRVLQALGVPLLGRLAGVDGNRVSFADDLGASVAFGDARWADICELMTTQLPARGFAVPELPIVEPFSYDPVCELDARAIGSVIVTSGFRPDYSWIDLPVVDQMGFPLAADGASTIVPGLYFCGVHFLRSRRSPLLFGVGADAAIVARLAAGADVRQDAARSRSSPK